MNRPTPSGPKGLDSTIARPGGISDLSSNVANQAIKRAKELPPGSVQKIEVDARGQEVSRSVEAKIKAEIVRKSGGIIKAENIQIRKQSR